LPLTTLERTRQHTTRAAIDSPSTRALMVASHSPPPLGGRGSRGGGALLGDVGGSLSAPPGRSLDGLTLLSCVSTCATGGDRQTGSVV